MRFLCLHGIGSNSRILQQQTAAIRYELGNRHTYDFVEGTLPWEPDPTLRANMLGDEKTFSYCDPEDADSCLQVIELLERYVAAEAPYDGVIGFSLGANIAVSWMIQRQGQGQGDLPFKVGIFFSNTFPLYDMEALQKGRVDYNSDQVADGYLDLSTAHIWGARDSGQEHAQIASRVCKEGKRSVYVHSGAHEITASPHDLINMVKVINRAIGQVS
ncbi:serine hydrolase FSH [Aspergillus varians]